jgi:hypothetical protein
MRLGLMAFGPASEAWINAPAVELDAALTNFAAGSDINLSLSS